MAINSRAYYETHHFGRIVYSDIINPSEIIKKSVIAMGDPVS